MGALRRGRPGKGPWGAERDAGQIAHPGGPEYALHPADGTQSGGNVAPRAGAPATFGPVVSSLLVLRVVWGGACSVWGMGQVAVHVPTGLVL